MLLKLYQIYLLKDNLGGVSWEGGIMGSWLGISISVSFWVVGSIGGWVG